MLEKIVRTMKNLNTNIAVIRSVQKIFLCLVLSLFFIGNILSQNSLPKGTKLKTFYFSKTINNKDLDYYQNTNYALVGFVNNNQFVEGQKIAIFENFRSKLSGDTLMSGIYVIKEGVSYLESTVPNQHMGGDAFTIGLYRVTNSKNGNNLTTSYSDADQLTIELVDIYYNEGFYNNSNQPVILEKQQDDYLLKIYFKDRILETIIKSENIRMYGFNNFIKSHDGYHNFIKSSQDIKLKYRDGNVFVGVVEERNYKYVARKGKYKFTTGETYVGEFDKDAVIDFDSYYSILSVPTKGETTFADGTSVNGNWLAQYNFTKDEWKRIYESSKSLTEIRDIAIRIDREKKGKLEEEKQIQKVEKQPYIDKYGEYWGSLVFAEEFTLGMTKPMVKDIVTNRRISFFLKKMLTPINRSVMDCYIVNKENSTETWTFNKNRFFEFMKKVEGKITNPGEQMTFREGMNTLKQPVMGQDMLKISYPTFVFTNGKLSEIYY